MTRKNPFITLDNANLKYFTSGSERNYSIIVYFKLKGYRIPPFFSMLNDNLQKIAESSRQPVNDHIQNVFFAKIVDNDLAKSFCNKFKFHLMPIVVHFPPVGEMNRKDTYDIRWNDGSIDNINFWVKVRTGSDITIVKQISIVKILFFVGFLALIYGIYLIFGKYMKIINKTFVWATIFIFFVAVMQGGFMYVYITGSPLMGQSGNQVVRLICLY
ncbi:Magnesium transporter protein 1 [Thelohanellus kitauei]|uniref:Magnesium transporter protein 1 n=1 Tax=Thelohanellus kitauei TaxID=669202 RepID=A0A0C2N143_THEKT|nr:Magnesium transporter protein 1 [Thelohanellus kitauei]